MAFGLLTGDRNLRDFAMAEGIAVHGTLWLLDELVVCRIITPFEAKTSLEAMQRSGSRLPHDEVLNRLRLWSQS